MLEALVFSACLAWWMLDIVMARRLWADAVPAIVRESAVVAILAAALVALGYGFRLLSPPIPWWLRAGSTLVVYLLIVTHALRGGGVLFGVPLLWVLKGPEKARSRVEKALRSVQRSQALITVAWLICVLPIVAVFIWALLIPSKVGTQLERGLPTVGAVTPAHHGGYVAAALNHPLNPSPVVVVAPNGAVKARSAPGTNPVEYHYPCQWFADGKSLLVKSITVGERDKVRPDLFVMDIATGRAAGSRLRGATGACVIGGKEIVCRLTGAARIEPAGVYLATMGGDSWDLVEVARDTESLRWTGCLWGSATDEGYRLILASESVEKGDDEVWSVSVEDAAVGTPHLLASGHGVTTFAVSPDGRVLALLSGVPPDVSLQLFSGRPPARERGRVALPDTVLGGYFRPDGEELLFFTQPLPESGDLATSPSLIILEVPTLEVRRVALPDLTDLADAGWLSDTEVALAVRNRGVVKADVTTGQTTDLCKITDLALPR